MKARLAFALSLSIEFDCYLIDEVIAVGDADLQQNASMSFLKNGKTVH